SAHSGENTTRHRCFFQDNSIQHNSFFSAPVQRASEPVVDPSTITTYPNAVKYIVSTLSRNDY
ncbi:hypothetical protein NADFUDRAFT_46921, partial [Nadsonia fulvescens var. elongata DSM 6958]